MISKKVEKSKLSERIGRKVLGLKHGPCENCHCEGRVPKQSLITSNQVMTAKLPAFILSKVI